MSAPVIGITMGLEPAQFDGRNELAHLLPYDYVSAVQRAGGVPLLLPTVERVVPAELLALVDGLLLSGGSDIDPAAYGAARHPMTTGTVPERDAFELALAREAIALDMPVTGICRGMQLINVALGGTLIQHIEPPHGDEIHRRTPGTFQGSDHVVRVAPGSLAAKVIAGERHRISSHHHQAVGSIGAGLVVSAWALGDELPEAIEVPGRRFVLGVQWHPEADPGSPVIGALVDEARMRGSG
ncbi:MAG TPA: gamma-glutamyl-gamma-aminobutyrate hydrolase family protein [Baekduia sp.]|nr:gamma-glutamyl-gamma-aminobutyrate hydrolase family protein [Baekduia sp.]